jgi:hypothetical protein
MSESEAERESYRDPSTGETFVVAFIGLLVFAAVAYGLDQDFRALIAGLSVACVVGVGWMYRPLIKRPRMWIVMLLMASFHGILVYLSPGNSTFRGAITLTPIVIADMYLWSRFMMFFVLRSR